MYSVIKKAKFEMAHMLTSSYAKECQAIHGHSYTLEVIVKAETLNIDGMVIDLKLLGQIIKEGVIDYLDHKLLVFEDDPIAPELTGIRAGLITATKYNPTAENMAADIHSILYAAIAKIISSIYSLTIRLHETDTGAVEFTGR